MVADGFLFNPIELNKFNRVSWLGGSIGRFLGGKGVGRYALHHTGKFPELGTYGEHFINFVYDLFQNLCRMHRTFREQIGNELFQNIFDVLGLFDPNQKKTCVMRVN